MGGFGARSYTSDSCNADCIGLHDEVRVRVREKRTVPGFNDEMLGTGATA